jgi:hypothetical protein
VAEDSQGLASQSHGLCSRHQPSAAAEMRRASSAQWFYIIPSDSLAAATLPSHRSRQRAFAFPSFPPYRDANVAPGLLRIVVNRLSISRSNNEELKKCARRRCQFGTRESTSHFSQLSGSVKASATDIKRYWICSLRHHGPIDGDRPHPNFRNEI